MRNLQLIFSNGFGHGLNILMGLAFAIGGARLLSLEDYGELRTVMTILPLLMAFSLPGYDPVILRNSSMNKPINLMRVFTLRFIFAVFGSFLLLAGVFLFREKIGETLFFFLIVSAALLPFFETGTGFRNYLIGSRLRQVALNIVIRTRSFSLIMFMMMISGIYFLKISPLAVLPAYLLSVIIPTFLAFYPIALRQNASKSGSCEENTKTKYLSEQDRRNLYAAIGATIASLAYTFAFSADKLWLRHEVGAAALASYAVLIMVPQEGSRLFDIMIPLFYRSLFHGKDASEKKKLTFAMLFVPAGVMVYVVTFYYLSPYIFGDSYKYDFLSVALSGLLMCGISFEFFCTHALLAKSGSRSLLGFTLTNLMVTIPVVYLSLSMGGGIQGLLIGLILKQFAVPLFFLLYKRNVPHVS